MTVQNGLVRSTLSWSELLATTYRIYAAHFGKFFHMAVGPAILAYFVHYCVLFVARQLSPTRAILYWVRLAIIGTIESALFWIISGFFFSAVAAAVLAKDNDLASPLDDSFSVPRLRVSAVLRVSLLVWSLFVLGRNLIALVLFCLLDKLPRQHSFWATTFLVGAMLLCIAGLLSRFGAAIPALMDERSLTVKEALKKSLAQTDNWELFFMVFLMKSALLGYCLSWVGNYGLGLLLRQGIFSGVVLPWSVAALNVALAAALETPLFIAFTVLYQSAQAQPSEQAVPAAIG